MAEEVIIKFDIGVATNNIARLEAELKKVKQEYKAAEIGSKDFYKAQDAGKQLTEQIKKQNDALKANTNALNGINSAAKFGKDSYGALKQSIKATKEELLKLDVGSEKFISTQNDLIALEKKRIDVEKQIPSLFQERIKGAIDEANSLAELREQIKQYTQAAVAGQEGAAEKLAELKDQLADATDATKTFAGSGVERLTASMNLLTEGLANFDLGKVEVAFNGVSAAMKAIPIFLIIEGLRYLISNFEKVTDTLSFFITGTDNSTEALKAQNEILQINDEAIVNSIDNINNLAQANADLALGVLASNKSISDIEGTMLKNLDKFSNALDKSLSEQQDKTRKIILANFKEQLEDLEEQGASEQQKIDFLQEQGLVKLNANQTQILATKFNFGKETFTIEEKRIKDSLSNLATQYAAESQLLENAYNDQNQIDLNAYKQQQEAEKKANEEKRKQKVQAANDLENFLRQIQINAIQSESKRAEEQLNFDEEKEKKELILKVTNKEKQQKALNEIEQKYNNERLITKKELAQKEIDFENLLTQYKIDLIKNDYKKSAEEIALQEKQELEAAEITYADNAEKLNKFKLAIKAKYAEEERKLALEYVTKDLQAEQELIIETQTSTLTEIFDAKQEILNQQRENALVNFQGTEQERLLLEQKYANDSIQIEKDKVEAKRQIRDSEIEFAKQSALALANVALIFSKGQEQQAAIAKTVALINIAANTATAISGLTAISFTPTNGDNGFNPLGPYIKLAAGIVAITSNIAQARQVINSFEQGGYTGEGPANEVSTNLGSKPYTYHKSEYVIPARVLGTPQGNMLAAQAESMRLGMSNPMPYIGGMFDGGFTARSAGAEANNTISNNAMLNQLLGNLPTPVVRVTDINKVQGDSIRVSQTSSL